MTEGAELNPKPTAYDAAAQVIEPFIAKAPEKLGDLLTWFPMQDDQKELENADSESKAIFLAEALGDYRTWSDAVLYLGMLQRPQDGEDSEARSLGLTQIQANEILPQVQEITKKMEKYLDFVVDDLLGGDLSIIGGNLKSMIQAQGFSMFVLHRDNKNPDMQVSFSDGSKPFTSFDALFYVDESGTSDLPIEESSYDQKTNVLKLQFSQKA